MIARSFRLLVVFAFACTACGAAGKVVQDVGAKRYSRVVVAPIDEAGRDPSLQAYRQHLLTALRSRDLDQVLTLAGPIAKLGAKLRRAPQESIYWDLLAEILSRGGGFTKSRGSRPQDEFCAPGTYVGYPDPAPGYYDEQAPWIIITEAAHVRSRPGGNDVTETLSYELVYVTGNQAGTPPAWMEVLTPSGKTGWVAAAQIRDPSEFHACFAKVRDTWELTEFVQSSPVDKWR